MADKATKSEARYQPRPHYNDHKKARERWLWQFCGRCTMFHPPHTCSAVQGDVSHHGWCKFFEAK